MPLAALAALATLAACGSPDATPGGGDPTDTGTPPPSLRVVTFNTGTTETMGAVGEDDGYGAEQAAISDQYYGDGLAWGQTVQDATAFFAQVDADVVVMQEVFWSGDCAKIPEKARAGFVCEDWQEGDETVAQVILGQGWQVACHPGKPDKCAAVHERVGRFSGCEQDFCLEGLYGGTVEGCGSGARVARGRIQRVDGSPLTLVSVHGSSGVTPEDQACRVAQVEQAMVDLGDGAPGADGEQNLVMGDLNTDPGRWTEWDESAARWTDFVGEGLDFHFVSDVGPDAPLSYQGVADIDHVMSDTWAGSCFIAGLTEDHPAVSEVAYFDHRPVVCDVVLAASP